MQKRAMNAMITSVLIMLFAIIAITLLTFVIKKTVTESLENQNVGVYTTQFEIAFDSVYVNQSNGTVLFNIKRKAGQGAIQGFLIILEDDYGKTQTYRGYDHTPLNELETLQVNFRHSLLGNITKIKVAAIVNSPTGKSIVGEAFSELTITPKGKAGPSGGGSPGPGTGPGPGDGSTPQCSDKIDNDGDGLIDFPQDPGCDSASDSTEQSTIPTNTQAHFTFEESTIDRAKKSIKDIAGNPYYTANHTTSIVTIASPFGQAVVFDGTNHYNVSRPTDFIYDTKDFAISAWFNASNVSGQHTIVAKSLAITGYGGYRLFIEDGTLKFRVSNTSITEVHITAEVSNIQKNVWYNAIATREGNAIKIYLDGVLKTTVNLPTAFNTSNGPNEVNSPLAIGSTVYWATAAPFNGTIDEVLMYNRALSSSEVTTLYNSYNINKNTKLPAVCKPYNMYYLVQLQDSANSNLANANWRQTNLAGLKYVRTDILTINTEFGLPHYDSTGAALYGGIPQAGDVGAYASAVSAKVTTQLTATERANFNGIAFIDLEAWYPQWDFMIESGDFGKKYVEESINLVKAEHPTWTDDALITATAKAEYDAAAKEYFIQAVNTVKTLLPNAKVGMYAFPQGPYLNGYSSGKGDTLRARNDEMSWLWNIVTVMLPNGYQSYDSIADTTKRTSNEQFIIDNVNEARRLSALYNNQPIYPFVWSRYHGTYLTDGTVSPFSYSLGFLNQYDLPASIEGPYNYGADGIVLWGYECTNPLPSDITQCFGKEIDYTPWWTSTFVPKWQYITNRVDTCK